MATLVAAAAVAVPHLYLKSRLTNSIKHSIVRGASGGILFGVALMHLLVDAQEDLSSVLPYPLANLCFVVGACLTAIIDVATHRRNEGCPDGELPAPATGSTPSFLSSAQTFLAISSADTRDNETTLLEDALPRSVLLGGEDALRLAARRRACVIQLVVVAHGLLHGLSLCFFLVQPAWLDTLAFGTDRLLEGLALGFVTAEVQLGRVQP